MRKQIIKVKIYVVVGDKMIRAMKPTKVKISKFFPNRGTIIKDGREVTFVCGHWCYFVTKQEEEPT